MGFLNKVLKKAVEAQTGINLDNIQGKIDLDKIKKVAEQTDWKKVAGQVGYAIQGIADAAIEGSQRAREEANNKRIPSFGEESVQQIEGSTRYIPKIDDQRVDRKEEPHPTLILQERVGRIEETTSSVQPSSNAPGAQVEKTTQQVLPSSNVPSVHVEKTRQSVLESSRTAAIQFQKMGQRPDSTPVIVMDGERRNP